MYAVKPKYICIKIINANRRSTELARQHSKAIIVNVIL